RANAACNPDATGWIVDQAGARNLATTGSILGGPVRVKGWTAPAVRVTCTPIDNPIAASGLNPYRGLPVVYVVTASPRCTDPALGFLRLLGLTAPAISVSHSERVIGPG